MLVNVVDIPNYLKVEEVKKNSHYLSYFLNDCILDNMRNLYINDKNGFNQLRKELHLRGIGFKSELQNNFLNGISYDIYPYIFINSNQHRYKEFPFEFFGLKNLIQDLKISSDYFFNYMPLHGFDKYIYEEKRELFLLKLQEFGFELMYENNGDYTFSKKNKFKVENFIPEGRFPHFIKYCQNLELNDINRIELILDDYKRAKGTRAKTYKSLKEFCINENLISENDLHHQKLYNQELKSLLEKYGYNFDTFMDKYFSEANLLVNKPYSYGLDIINKIFKENEVKQEKLKENIDEKLTKLKNHVNYEFVKDIKISSIIRHYNLSNIFINEDRFVNELGDELQDRSIIDILFGFIESLPNLNEVSTVIAKSINDNQHWVLLKRNEGLTLEEIAKEKGLTRERIRQIEKKAKQKLKNSINFSKIIDFVLFKYRNKTIIQTSEILSFLNLEATETFVIETIFEENDKLSFINNYGLIIDKNEYIKVSDEVKYFYSRGISVVSLHELKSINEYNMQIAVKMFRKFNYKLINNNFVQSNISIVNAIEYVMSCYPDDIFINDERGYNFLTNKIKYIFDKEIDSNPRALFSRVADANNVILIDRNAYKYEDFSDIDGEFLIDLKNIIENVLENAPYADPRLIYKNYPKIMKENHVFSYSHLYSIIKNYLQEDFNIGFQNTLYIYPEKTEKLKAEHILIDYLRKVPSIGINDLANKLKWKKLKLEQIIPRLDNVIVNSKQEVILIEGIENEQGYFQLIELIKNEIKNGYIITIELFLKVIFNNELSEMLNNYQLNDLQSFSQFIKSKFMYMHGFHQFLYSKHSTVRNIEDIIPKYLPKMFSNKDLQQFIIDKGYSQQRYYKAREILLENNKIIPYRNDLFINLEKYSLPTNMVNKISEYLNYEISKQEVITIKQLSNTNFELDDSLTTTPELVAYIAKQIGFKLHEAYYGSMYELPIITASKYSSYSEIIYTFVQEKFKDVYSEQKLLESLKYEGLINKNADQIYSSIRESSYFEFDNIGFFKLKAVGEINA